MTRSTSELLATRSVMRAAARRPRPQSVAAVIVLGKLALTYLFVLHPAWVIGRALLPIDRSGESPTQAMTLFVSAVLAMVGVPLMRSLWRRD